MIPDEIIKILKSDPNLKTYQELEIKINQDPYIKNELETIKQLQRDLVKAESLKNHTKIKALKNDYEKRLAVFLKRPLFQEYFDLQEHYNDILSFIKETLTSEINKELNNWKMA